MLFSSSSAAFDAQQIFRIAVGIGSAARICSHKYTFKKQGERGCWLGNTPCNTLISDLAWGNICLFYSLISKVILFLKQSYRSFFFHASSPDKQTGPLRARGPETLYHRDNALLYIAYVWNAYLGCTYPCRQVALQSVAIANTLG